MSKWTIDNILIIGVIFTGIWLFLNFANPFPFKLSFDGFLGHLWIAWIVISSLMLAIGILVKIINR